MLELALRGELPLITVRTTDILNFPEVLGHLTDKVIYYLPKGVLPGIAHNCVYWTDTELDITSKVIGLFADTGSSLIVANQGPNLMAYDAGVAPVPEALLRQYLSYADADTDEYVRLSAGLTIKETVEVIKLAQAYHGALTPRAFREFRTLVAGTQQGIQPVSTEYDFYEPRPILTKWMKENKSYFLKPVDPRLTPRGILFDGPPGVGKTMAAKHIAREWGVPLYRLDMGASLGKYVGESEANLSRILTTVDREEPCILLIDEVEKLFGESEDSGVTSRLLGQLLWWLQEHTSTVLTVMTTNDKSALPPELIRTGRIDMEITMWGLDFASALTFAVCVLAQFVPSPTTPQIELVHARIAAINPGRSQPIPQAVLVGAVYDLIKAQKWVT